MPAKGAYSALTGDCIAGFLDAEACFAIVEMNGGASFSCGMTVAVRDDDIDLLHAMPRATGLGVVRRKENRGNRQACWSVYRRSDAVALASFLTRHPLRSRKRNDFEVWRAAVDVWAGNDDRRRSRMAMLAREIRDARRYRPLEDVVPTTILRRGFYDWLGGSSPGTDISASRSARRPSAFGSAPTMRRSLPRSEPRQAPATSMARTQIRAHIQLSRGPCRGRRSSSSWRDGWMAACRDARASSSMSGGMPSKCAGIAH